MRAIKITLCVVAVMLIILLAGCGRPEYLNPYGEDVDPATVTTGEFQSRPSVSMTEFRISPASTTTASTVAPTQPVVPAGYRLCPDCDGIRVVCPYCKGTKKRQGERWDADSDVYVKYYAYCNMCSKEDPGYMYCKTCKNLLLIPE